MDNEYTHEIAELRSQVDALIEAEGDRKEIAEREMQLQVMRAIYERATQLYRDGAADEEMRHRLAIRGYGDWTLDNVYAFVYDSTSDLPVEEHRSFVGEIREADFASQLR